MKKTIIALCALSPLAHADNTLGDFFTKSKYDVTIESVYQGIKSGRYDKTGKANLTNWVKAAAFDFTSPDENVFGFNFGLYAVGPIRYGPAFYNKKVLKYRIKPNGEYVAEGFSKVSHAVLTQHFKVNGFDTHLYEGLRVLRDFGALNREDEVIESAYYGLTGETKSKNWLIKGGYLTQYSDSNASSRADFKTKEGIDIDYINTLDVTYKHNNHSYRYVIGEGQDYLRSQIFEYAYRFSNKRLSSKLFYVNALENYKNMSARNKMFDKQAYLAQIKAEFFYPSDYLALGYSYTKANRAYGLGSFENDLASGTKGNNVNLTHAFTKDFNFNNENLLAAIYFHTFNESYKAGFLARYGFGFHYKGARLHEYEVGLVSIYTPQQVKGLTLLLAVTPNNSFRRGFDNNPYLDANGKASNFNGSSVLGKVIYKF
ncbi:hypothetical protein MSP8887_01070 [Marinomonas spartinae]|uniref:Outer membrane porin, OprD family n=1 Tax=Marinomonas spartinae TaxID=1792290 RepID=A0A1A8TRB0_9GAMM|nr:hypothetical protein [Marinomonas spartinae]SBS29472.1 hypothetical protein MSP8887_01070 [Marinomonas spartinae]SBS37027.1 hypothetical protein MSP8886_03948 [Marinomonas spartinae]